MRSAWKRAAQALAGVVVAWASFGAADAAISRAVPPAVLYREGLRWLGTSTTCASVGHFQAARLFSFVGMPTSLSPYCLYTWTSPSVLQAVPTSLDIANLFKFAGSPDLTEDVPVAYPLTSGPEATAQFYGGLRNALVDHVGGVSLLPVMPQLPRVRVVVIDSAPDSPHAGIVAGPSRHGDTLAHLIEDLVCKPLVCRVPGNCTAAEISGRVCAAEVTSALALPWSMERVFLPTGGHIGTLSDVARAVARALHAWQTSSPQHKLILNLSIGWENTANIADCTTGNNERPPARAVKAVLQHAASLGALIIAAAGNDSGGSPPRTGLLCPAAYQIVQQVAAPTKPLLVAVSGVDYADRVLETVRVDGTTAISALGLGGVSWVPGAAVPPQLVGSSVSAAVVSAVSALVWTAKPTYTAGEVWNAIYEGGVSAASPVGSTVQCPYGMSSCQSRRASTCGALLSASLNPTCVVPPPKLGSSPVLPDEVATLKSAYAGSVISYASQASVLVPSTIPRFLVPSIQVEPAAFPQPISATCPTCFVGSSFGGTTVPTATLPGLGAPLIDPVLVVRTASGGLYSIDPQLPTTLTPPCNAPCLLPNTPYSFEVSVPGVIVAAYLTGYTMQGYSTTEQLFVEQ